MAQPSSDERGSCTPRTARKRKAQNNGGSAAAQRAKRLHLESYRLTIDGIKQEPADDETNAANTSDALQASASSHHQGRFANGEAAATGYDSGDLEAELEESASGGGEKSDRSPKRFHKNNVVVETIDDDDEYVPTLLSPAPIVHQQRNGKSASGHVKSRMRELKASPSAQEASTTTREKATPPLKLYLEILAELRLDNPVLEATVASVAKDTIDSTLPAISLETDFTLTSILDGLRRKSVQDSKVDSLGDMISGAQVNIVTSWLRRAFMRQPDLLQRACQQITGRITAGNDPIDRAGALPIQQQPTPPADASSETADGKSPPSTPQQSPAAPSPLRTPVSRDQQPPQQHQQQQQQHQQQQQQHQTPSSRPRRSAHSSRHRPPVLVPYTRPSKDKKILLFFADTPDAPLDGLEREHFHDACAETFGRPLRGVEQWNQHLWAAHFSSHPAGQNPPPHHRIRAGVTVDVGGVALRGELQIARTPRTFACEVPRRAVPDELVKEQIAVQEAFSYGDWSLYAWDSDATTYFMVHFHTPPELYRFYLPLQSNLLPGAGNMLVFKAMDPTRRCAYCNARHRHHFLGKELCTIAKLV